MSVEKIELFNKDCMQALKDLPEKSIDLVVTDPPYIVQTQGGGVEPLAIEIENGTKKLNLWQMVSAMMY